MKASKTLWIKRIVIGTAVAALPQVLLARGPAVDNGPERCPPRPLARDGALPPPPEIPAGLSSVPPWLDAIELTDAQQDALFDLTHAQASVTRRLERKAARALDELRRLSADRRFNAKQARLLADSYAQALAEQTFNQAELDSKIDALLTPEQRAALRPGRRSFSQESARGAPDDRR